MPVHPYTLEQAEEDIGRLRGQLDRLAELLTQADAGNVTPNTPVGGYSMFSSAGQQKYQSDDGSAYNTGRNTQLPTSSPLINSQTFTGIPGMTTLLAPGTYRVSGMILCVPNVQGGAVELQIHTPDTLVLSANSRLVFNEIKVSQPSSIGNSQEVTALDSPFTGTNFGVGLETRFIAIDGTLIVNTAGTISLQAATTIAADTYNVRQYGTFLDFMPVS